MEHFCMLNLYYKMSSKQFLMDSIKQDIVQAQQPKILVFRKDSKLKSNGSLKNLRRKISNRNSIVNRMNISDQKLSPNSIGRAGLKPISNSLKRLQQQLNKLKPCFHIIERSVFDDYFKQMQNYMLSQTEQLLLVQTIWQYLKACQVESLQMKKQEWINDKVREVSSQLSRISNQVHFQHVRALKILQHNFSDLSAKRRKSMGMTKNIFQKLLPYSEQIDEVNNKVTNALIDVILKQAHNFQNMNKINMNQLQFNLSDSEQAYKVSTIVKQCTQFDLDAFLFLSDYLEECVVRMAQSGKTIFEIQSQLQQTINMLKKEHPPNDQIPLGQNLHEIPSRKSKWMGDYKRINLKEFSPERRNLQLQNFILKIAQTAKENLEKLIEITKQPCNSNNGLSYKTGIKVKSDCNRSSIDRVKQKLLSTNFSILEISKDMNNLKQFLQLQEKSYHEQLAQIFAEAQQEIVFTVSDMLRGKCMFREIEQINSAAMDIIQKCQQKGYPIKQIDNRLAKGTTDLVLKIQIQGIIAEFQLAYKFNIVKNQFNHKLYQLSRSKFFTVISNLFRFNEKTFRVFGNLLQRVQKVKSTGKQIRVQLQNKQLQSIDFLSEQFDKYIEWRKDNRQDLLDQSKNLITASTVLQTSNLQNTARKVTNLISQINNYDQKQADQFMVILRTGIFLKHSENLQKAKNKIKQGIQRLQGPLQNTKQLIGITLYQQNDRVNGSMKIELTGQSKESTFKRSEKQVMKLKRMLGSINFHLKLDDEALQNYEEILQKQKFLSGQDSIDYARVLNNLGVVERGKGNLQAAYKHLTESLRIQKQYIASQEQKLDVRISQKAFRKVQNNLSLADTMNNIGLIEKGKGNYEAALQNFQQCLQIQLQSKGRQSLQCAKTMDNIGTVYYQRRQYNNALSYFQQSLQTKNKLKGKDSLESSDSLNNIGIVHLEKKDFQMALKYFQGCLQIKEKIKGRQSIDSVNILNNIGSVYKQQRELNFALKYFLQSLTIQQKIKGAQSIDCAVTLHNIGSVYDAKQQYSKALSYYNKSLKIKQHVKGDKSIDCADTLNNMGIVYSKNHEYQSAFELFTKATEIHKQIKGEKSLDYSDSLLNLAITLKNLQNRQEALQNFQKILAIQTKIKGSYHEDIAEIMSHMGQIYQQQNKLEKALQFYSDCLKINQNLYNNSMNGPSQTNASAKISSSKTKLKNYQLQQLRQTKIKNCFYRIASVYEAAFDSEKVLIYYAKVQEMVKKQIDRIMESSQCQTNKQIMLKLIMQLVKVLQLEGQLLKGMNMFEQSLKKYSMAIQQVKQVKDLSQNSNASQLQPIFDLISQKQIVLLQDIASLYSQNGKFEQALSYYRQSIVKLQKSTLQISMHQFNSQENNPEIKNIKIKQARIFNNIGSIYYKKKDFACSCQYFEKCEKMLRQSKGPNDLECINVIDNLGLVYYQRGQYKKTIQKLCYSLQIKKQMQGVSSKACAKTLNTIGAAWSALHDFDKAIQCYKQCLVIQETLRQQNSMDYTNTLSNLGSVYSSTGKFKEALGYYQKCLAIQQTTKGKNSNQYQMTNRCIKSINIKLEQLGQLPRQLANLQ